MYCLQHNDKEISKFIKKDNIILKDAKYHTQSPMSSITTEARPPDAKEATRPNSSTRERKS